jgi:hypothetical protein
LIFKVSGADLAKMSGIDFNPAAGLKSMLWWIKIISVAGNVLGPPFNPGVESAGRA